MITLEQFKNNTLGGSYGNPGTGTFKGQCVSYVRQYMEQVLGIKTIINGHASNYYNSAFMAQHFDKVPQGQEQNGDILCWGDDAGTWTGPEGHIGISYNGQILNQNYGGSLKVTINPFFTQGYQGALRVKGVDMKLNKTAWQQLAHGILGRNGLSDRTNALDGSSDNSDYIGRELDVHLINELFISDEAKKWRDSKQYASIPEIQARLNSIPAKDKEIAALKAQLANGGTGVDQATKDKITETNTNVSWIKDLLSRVFK